jgi:hypothetical protein
MALLFVSSFISCLSVFLFEVAVLEHLRARPELLPPQRRGDLVDPFILERS